MAIFEGNTLTTGYAVLTYGNYRTFSDINHVLAYLVSNFDTNLTEVWFQVCHNDEVISDTKLLQYDTGEQCGEWTNIHERIKNMMLVDYLTVLSREYSVNF